MTSFLQILVAIGEILDQIFPPDGQFQRNIVPKIMNTKLRRYAKIVEAKISLNSTSVKFPEIII